MGTNDRPDIPSEPNLFGSLDTDLMPERVAALFEAAGWTVRRCARTDYEVFAPFAELVIEGRNPVLIHGPVADVLANVGRVAEPLTRARLGYSFECYGTDRELLRTVTSRTS